MKNVPGRENSTNEDPDERKHCSEVIHLRSCALGMWSRVETGEGEREAMYRTL